jgi:hypothetical protein
VPDRHQRLESTLLINVYGAFYGFSRNSGGPLFRRDLATLITGAVGRS